MGARMADGVDTGAGEPGQEKVELRIAVSGTHTRRDDLEALHTWLRSAPVWRTRSNGARPARRARTRSRRPRR